MEYVSLTQWLLTFAMFALILGYEVFQALRNPHQPSLKSSAVWSVLYIVAAMAFALVIMEVWDRELAVEYVTGYVTERALSIDNLFIFILIMTSFAVPRLRATPRCADAHATGVGDVGYWQYGSAVCVRFHTGHLRDYRTAVHCFCGQRLGAHGHGAAVLLAGWFTGAADLPELRARIRAGFDWDEACDPRDARECIAIH